MKTATVFVALGAGLAWSSAELYRHRPNLSRNRSLGREVASVVAAKAVATLSASLREADRAMQEAQAKLRQVDILADRKTLFGDRVELIELGYDTLMKEACPIRRHGYAKSRADAVEVSFDFLLAKLARGKWERLGEVHLDRDRKVAEAVCRLKPGRVRVASMFS